MIKIDITPIGKPRMTQRDKWQQRPAVMRYRAFKDLINLKCNKLGFELPAELIAQYHIPMPKSWSKKKKKEMLGKPHQQKPDIDNINKAVMDALAKEDSFVYSVNCQKYWTETGKGMIIFNAKN